MPYRKPAPAARRTFRCEECDYLMRTLRAVPVVLHVCRPNVAPRMLHPERHRAGLLL